ncbi:MAG: hypothetical protein L0H93_22420 [Nocardioides sp.]|nr:hypothetical protein [Nocardioides sp.]
MNGASEHGTGLPLQSIAHDLWAAATQSLPIQPSARELGNDVDAAYQVQDLLTLKSIWAGAAVSGHKVTSHRDLPCFGVLFDAMHHAGPDPLDCGHLIRPRVQVGVGFVVGEDLTGRSIDPTSAASVVSAVVPVVEVVDSRIATDSLEQVDVVADNAGAARYVVGDLSPAPDLEQPLSARLERDGKPAADDGPPIRPTNAFAWLTGSLRALGLPLLAGELVLVGELTRSLPGADADWTGSLAGIGDVTVTTRLAAASWRRSHPNTRSYA